MLRLQRTPLLNLLPIARRGAQYPQTVVYGDVVKGLPVDSLSADLAYCSHTLEHLSLGDCRIALKETFRILKPGGVFRAVLPDLRFICQEYLSADGHDPEAAIRFIGRTHLGLEETPQGIDRLRRMFSRSFHLWMWDYPAMRNELEKAGFVAIRPASFGDSSQSDFTHVESAPRWQNALGFEAIRPAK
jgi:ubiquinone/menaquinone biosynthesis C-methylase UbiE